MEFWPADKKQLQRIIISLLLISLIGFFLLAILFIRYKNLAESPPCTTVSSFHLQPQAPPCAQRVEESGWTISDGEVRTFPRCLTIMNSRFGSRFNLDWYFSKQKVTSSVLGTLEDQDTYLTLEMEDNDETEQIFPLLSNSSFPNQSVDLGLTYQKINFENNDFLVSLKATSPFSPSQSIKDGNNKMNAAPFFYLELSLINKTPLVQVKTISLSLGNAKEFQSKNGTNIVYLNDRVRKDGLRALVARENQVNLTPFIDRGQGGFNWQTEVKPNSSVSISLIYAGFLDGAVITDTSQLQKRKLKFAYSQWFKNIDEVIKFASENQQNFVNKTGTFEKSIQNQKLSPQIKWLLAQSFHSYLGNTWLVYDEKDADSYQYYVWEGEFKYLNTVDVAHDYGVLEGLYFPWVLKLELESWRKNTKEEEKGIVIPHDLGQRFNLKGAQAYGIEGWKTSGMPVEENVNFILLAYWYWQQANDDQFIKELSPLIKDLIESLIKRDANYNGIADEIIGITTYDNDGNSALKEAPDSSYLALKQLAAYVSAEEIFKFLGDEQFQELTNKQSELITESLKEAYQTYGFIPLSLDPSFKEKNQFKGKPVYGTEEQGFVFITGLFYPVVTNLESNFIKELVPLLADSYPQAYRKSLVQNEEGEIIGLQLAENQAFALGWFSHSIMADIIAQKLFNQKYSSVEIFFPLLYDNPGSFADGYFFKEPFYPPQTSLVFYPRGVVLFAYLGNNE